MGGYGDVGGHLEHATDTAHSFSAPHVELLPSGSSGDFSFLAEINFEIGEANTFNSSAERLEVAYLVDDRLRLRAGRFHTAIGYYNDAYHHGTYFLLPTDRPLWLDFEDGGGLIPSHAVGVHADGRFRFGVGSLRYDLDLANGRGRRLVEVQNLTDDNKSKAINARLRFEPELLPGLVIGANLYLDRIAANTDADLAAPIPEMDERIIGVHAAYIEGRIHLIAEAAFFSHDERKRSKSYATQAYLLEAGYELERAFRVGLRALLSGHREATCGHVRPGDRAERERVDHHARDAPSACAGGCRPVREHKGCEEGERWLRRPERHLRSDNGGLEEGVACRWGAVAKPACQGRDERGDGGPHLFIARVPLSNQRAPTGALG